MIRVLLILILIASPVLAQNDTALAHVSSLERELSRAKINLGDADAALIIAAQREAKMKLWGIEQQKRADAAESQFGYRAWAFLKFWVTAITASIVGLYALFIILKLVGLVAVGPVGAFVSWATSIGLGWLPGSGWLDTVFSNLFWRVIKPRAERAL